MGRQGAARVGVQSSLPQGFKPFGGESAEILQTDPGGPSGQPLVPLRARLPEEVLARLVLAEFGEGPAQQALRTVRPEIVAAVGAEDRLGRRARQGPARRHADIRGAEAPGAPGRAEPVPAGDAPEGAPLLRVGEVQQAGHHLKESSSSSRGVKWRVMVAPFRRSGVDLDRIAWELPVHGARQGCAAEPGNRRVNPSPGPP